MQEFGGTWTEIKLNILKGYLSAYTGALKNQTFKKIYIDAFAGTGYCKIKDIEQHDDQLCIFEDAEVQEYIEGSARIALKTEPCFDEFHFIDIKKKHVKSLESLREDFPELNKRMHIYNEDANEQILKLCDSINWKKNRAVLFLDPFAMSVEWPTIQRIARTNAVDLWYLFPLKAVNRLLKKNGDIIQSWKTRLDKTLGTTDWFDVFYKDADAEDNNEQLSFDQLIGEVTEDEGPDAEFKKVANFNIISEFMIQKLNEEFVGVSEFPKVLKYKNSPLFLFCFACSNERGKPIALRIANHLLKRD